MKTELSYLEPALREVETLLGVRLTVIDRNGIFHTPEGYAILSPVRQSHRKNPICDCGFSNQKCIGHCRHTMNAQGEKERKPFVHTCWKGVMELVVPLIKENIHYGSLFAGCWRVPGKQEPMDRKMLPKKMIELYRNLPEYDDSLARRIRPLLELVAQGILAVMNPIITGGPLPPGTKRRIREFIHQHASEAVTLPQLAAELTLSPSRTAHRVTELFGKSFRVLLREERLTRARYLLLNTDLPLNEIAAMVGIPDIYHFNRMFKKSEGSPPGKFRKSRILNPT